MKSYKISSKVYVSMALPMDATHSLVIPKKGQSVSAQFEKIPDILKNYEAKNLISIEEIDQ